LIFSIHTAECAAFAGTIAVEKKKAQVSKRANSNQNMVLSWTGASDDFMQVHGLSDQDYY
jgi:hypothetical protein